MGAASKPEGEYYRERLSDTNTGTRITGVQRSIWGARKADKENTATTTQRSSIHLLRDVGMKTGRIEHVPAAESGQRTRARMMKARVCHHGLVVSSLSMLTLVQERR